MLSQDLVESIDLKQDIFEGNNGQVYIGDWTRQYVHRSGANFYFLVGISNSRSRVEMGNEYTRKAVKVTPGVKLQVSDRVYLSQDPHRKKRYKSFYVSSFVHDNTQIGGINPESKKGSIFMKNIDISNGLSRYEEQNSFQDPKEIPPVSVIYTKNSENVSIYIENDNTLDSYETEQKIYPQGWISSSVKIKGSYLLLHKEWYFRSNDSRGYDPQLSQRILTVLEVDTMKEIYTYKYKYKPVRGDGHNKKLEYVDENSRHHIYLENNTILNLETLDEIVFTGELLYFDDEYLVARENDRVNFFEISYIYNLMEE